MRVPAVQTLLLYAKTLDTNEHCTRILCDEWIEIRFLDSELAQSMLSAVLYLRSSIDRLFKIRLEDRMNVFKREECEIDDLEKKENEMRKDNHNDAVDTKERAKKLEKILKKKLSEFLDSSILYAMRRVLPAELNTIYVKNFKQEEDAGEKNTIGLNSDLQKLIDKGGKVNEAKGGYKITNYLTYNW